MTENYGRGRTVLFATEGSWRWKMWLDHADKTHATFWQQMFRYLVTDTPGAGDCHHARSRCSADETRVPIRVEVRDKQYKPVTNAKVQARFLGPDGTSATMELAPVPLEEGIYGGEWTAEKPGSYVAEIIAGHETGRDRARRADVPPRGRSGREFPYFAEPGTAAKSWRSRPAGGTTSPDEASKLANEISYSEAGITARETRDLWDMPIDLPAGAGDSAPASGCCGASGAWYEAALAGLLLLAALLRAPRTRPRSTSPSPGWAASRTTSSASRCGPTTSMAA